MVVWVGDVWVLEAREGGDGGGGNGGGGGGGWDATNGIYGRLKALLSDRRSHWRYWSENDAHAQCKRMVPSVATAGCCC